MQEISGGMGKTAETALHEGTAHELGPTPQPNGVGKTASASASTMAAQDIYDYMYISIDRCSCSRAAPRTEQGDGPAHAKSWPRTTSMRMLGVEHGGPPGGGQFSIRGAARWLRPSVLRCTRAWRACMPTTVPTDTNI